MPWSASAFTWQRPPTLRLPPSLGSPVGASETAAAADVGGSASKPAFPGRYPVIPGYPWISGGWHRLSKVESLQYSCTLHTGHPWRVVVEYHSIYNMMVFKFGISASRGWMLMFCWAVLLTMHAPIEQGLNHPNVVQESIPRMIVVSIDMLTHPPHASHEY